MNKNLLYSTLLIAIGITFVSCLAGPNAATGIPGGDGGVAGFWMGLWHGIIAPVTFIISLFTDNIQMYEIHNNGNWYDFGFVLGAGILFGGGHRASRKKRR